MSLWPDSVILEGVKAFFGLLLLGAGWFVGQRIVAAWDIRKKLQELDINSAVQFQQLYGELKEVGRLWREANNPNGLKDGIPPDLRWTLLSRGANAESRYEAVAMKLASERLLTPTQLFILGLFRQACQQLRQSMRTGGEVSWSDFRPEYFLFNDLAAAVTCMIAEPRPNTKVAAEVARLNLNTIAGIRGRHWRAAVQSYSALHSQRDHRVLVIKTSPKNDFLPTAVSVAIKVDEE